MPAGKAVGNGGGVVERSGYVHIQETPCVAATLMAHPFFGVGKSLSNIPKSIHPCLLKYTLFSFLDT